MSNGVQIDYQPAIVTDANNNPIGLQQICVSRGQTRTADNSADTNNQEYNNNINVQINNDKINNIQQNVISNQNDFWEKGLLNKGNLFKKLLKNTQ